ncbi:type I polyketide synthase [Desulfonema magnum]|uniref:Phenolphthiocerol/phthiocerol polyketide synthase subunit E n=1 Tax=Desulfonema magnum TaxID=45655 RepID=A0A975BTT0_9BACT|nr:type I polyketide synthase [Desulfonema magnum]QTA91521.1 Acyl transferase domain-containing protein [Desulfonema magnum]
MESVNKLNTAADEASVAIIGMSCRFPEASDIETFWQNLKQARECISFFSDEELTASGTPPYFLKMREYVRAKAIIPESDMFDASFFGFNPGDAEMTDIQHRIFLECAWEVLESAGYDPAAYKGLIGLYAGAGINTYFLNNIYPNLGLVGGSADAYQVMLSNDRAFLPTMISYKLNLRGPSLNVQTACSTSLVAVHLACQSLLNGECDMAMAGGVSAGSPPKEGYVYEEGMILSPDGHCRAFDAKAGGTVPGNGCGIVLLKRLPEALTHGDYIYAVIRGSAVNNDGSLKVGYTAPGVTGQRDVIAEAQAIADIPPDTITYVETHGTGTVLGDPIEIQALTEAFHTGTEKKKFCAIGSVKTNIGHLDAAAGVASLIKTALVIKHGMIPPSLHFEAPNPKIAFENSPFYVNTELSEWNTGDMPRRAGVSSFGIGGTNAHMILEEWPAAVRAPRTETDKSWHLVLLSAKTESALNKMTVNLADHLKSHPEIQLADVAYTLQAGRKGFDYRGMALCQNITDAETVFRNMNPRRVLTSFRESQDRSVAFMFSGQGSQYVNMGRGLYQIEPAFREQVDLCSELLRPHLGYDLRLVLYPPGTSPDSQPSDDISRTAVAQPALFVIEYALARLLMEWGIHPKAMIGHSIGEYVAACIAGVFSLEDALSLVAARGQMVQELPGGAMTALPLPEKDIIPLLGSTLSLAAVNAPCFCVVSGSVTDIEQLENQLAPQGIEYRRLHTSHAFHSEMMDPVMGKFTELVGNLRLNRPQIPYISNLTGTWITEEQATDPAYWAKHLRETVRFSDGVKELLRDPGRILLEVGPGRTLSTLAMRQTDRTTEQIILNSLRHPRDQQSDEAFILTTLGRLWLAGVSADWNKFHAREQRYRVPLPTYPFERKRYWAETGDRKPKTGTGPETQSRIPSSESQQNDISEKKSPSQHSGPNLANAYVAPRNETEQILTEIFRELLGVGKVGIYDSFFELGGHSLLATRVASRLREKFRMELSLSDLFEEPTVAGLAGHIKNIHMTLQKLQAPPDPKTGNRTEGEL